MHRYLSTGLMNKILVKSIGRVLRKLLFRVGFRPRISKLKVQSDNIANSAQLNWGLAEGPRRRRKKAGGKEVL